MNSKVKAAFTREYNKGVHKSQALVEEQGVTKKRKRSATSTEANSDYDGDDVSEEEEVEDVEILKKLFKKRSSSGKAGNKKKGPSKRNKK